MEKIKEFRKIYSGQPGKAREFFEDDGHENPADGYGAQYEKCKSL